jgi:hypothetical protein
MGPTDTGLIDSRTAIGSIGMGIVTYAGVTITTTKRVVGDRAAAAARLPVPVRDRIGFVWRAASP